MLLTTELSVTPAPVKLILIGGGRKPMVSELSLVLTFQNISQQETIIHMTLGLTIIYFPEGMSAPE